MYIITKHTKTFALLNARHLNVIKKTLDGSNANMKLNMYFID